VFQDFKLFSFSLGQNVATQVNYDEQKVVQSLEEAGFGQRYNTLKDGAKTYLYTQFEKSGIEISGGEAQKIALARALYKAAPFIVLDEPTAALDPIAEFEIYTKFNEIVGNKTAIYISHRLSSCRFCDDIVVFDSGQIIQRGSHDKLLQENNGKYIELWNAQAQYYT
jgi:ATP-binding cassette subfamily B protein